MPEQISFCSIIQFVSTQTTLFEETKVDVKETLLQRHTHNSL